ncbi:MAG: aminopeptidase P N-terminal domain-containing protein [Labilithrix sp.]|nr:aminopeptidase P N-terminal domain-containing protein [Labilithrix sp.]MCW5814350.1 aminopeptidase P N-terminal domain-containing protein [Labilithrix sp.]
MCTCHSEVHGKRRRAFMETVAAKGDDWVAVFASAPVFTRNNDVEHEYRQDSDLFYLTGWSEPGTVLVVTAEKTTMFVRARDPERETWDGPRYGVDGVKEHFGADEAFTIDKVAEELPKLFQNKKRLYYRLGPNRAMDDKVLEGIDRARARGKLGHAWPTEIVDPGTVLHEMRLFKHGEDLAAMRRAAEITAEAHLRAMRSTKPGMHEFQVEAMLLETFRMHGSERPAYGSIVGSGVNATILHYRQNNKKMEDGELLLIDAGCEYDYYASDVTRTFPVGGAFNKQQETIYNLVLDAQLAGIEKARKGSSLEQIHNTCVDVITRGLVTLGLLEGDVETLIKEEKYKPFYMHKTCHWLGMDVHDVGNYYVGGKARTLEPGMVLTVEPGIYIAKNNDKVPAEWRGIGVRIEDDILVTEGEPDNLTASIPKKPSELLAACA